MGCWLHLQTMVSPRPKKQRELASRTLGPKCLWNNKFLQELDTHRQRPRIAAVTRVCAFLSVCVFVRVRIHGIGQCHFS